MNKHQWDNLAFALFLAVVVGVVAVVVGVVVAVAALVGVVALALVAPLALVENPKLAVVLELLSIAISISAIIYAAPYIGAPTVQVVCFHTVTNSQIVINGTATVTQTHTAVTNQTMTELASRSYTC